MFPVLPFIWFWIVAVMASLYVVLDGFDLGAGIIHLFVARTDRERRMVLRAIGPVWDGNEVWLLAAGGCLYFSFPLLYASSFSGFYLPLIMVLWLLILRAIGIEFRIHLEAPIWQSFFDTVFALASVLLAIFFGAALGNVIRGVPLDKAGYFFEPLWTNWRVGEQTGILDWYTVMAGVIALVILAQHGALYIATKTEGELNQRSRAVVNVTWPLVFVLSIVGLAGTLYARPELMANYRAVPLLLVIPLLVFVLLGGLRWAHGQRKEKAAFVLSALYIVLMLVGAAVAVFPNVLSARNPAYSLTIYNAAAADYGLKIGLIWWVMGALLAAGYFTFLFRMFRGKVSVEGEGY
jgi:cytochrome d ubiquinol oxidase subunit II